MAEAVKNIELSGGLGLKLRQKENIFTHIYVHMTYPVLLISRHHQQENMKQKQNIS